MNKYDRKFKDHETGFESIYPWDKDDAAALGYTKYADRNGCETCGTNHFKIRYVENDACIGCMNLATNEDWRLYLMGMPGRPEPFPLSRDDAHKMGVDYYYGNPYFPVLCPNGPHLRRTDVKSGRCQGCEDASRRARDMGRGPRAIARSNGEKYYIPNEPCPQCGNTAPRHVITDNCRGCTSRVFDDAAPDMRKTPSTLFAEQNPDYIMSKEDAKLLGFTLYRTGEYCRRGHAGWRYVSTGNCVECRKS